MAALNLLPIGNLDGRTAWGILPYLARVEGTPAPPRRFTHSESVREPSRAPPPPRRPTARPRPGDDALPPLPPEIEESVARLFSEKRRRR